MENLKNNKKAVFGILGVLVFIGTIVGMVKQKPKAYEVLTLNKDSKGNKFANVKEMKI